MSVKSTLSLEHPGLLNEFAFVCELWLVNKTMSLPSLHMFVVGQFANTKAENQKPNRRLNTKLMLNLNSLK